MKFILLVLPLVLVVSAPAAEFPLAQALEAAQAHNPEITAAYADWEAAQARILPEKTWNAPQVGIEYWGFTGANPGSASEKWYDIGQEIPFPGKLRLKGEASAHEARRLKEAYRAVQLDVETRVKTAYYRYLLSTKAETNLTESADVMRRFSKTTEAKYAANKASQSDVLRAQVELSKTLGALLMLGQEKTAAQAQLNALLGRTPDQPLGTPQDPSLAPLSLKYQDLERTALAQRPEVLEASHHIEHEKANLAAQRAEYLPDFSLQYSRRTRDGMPGDSIAMFKMSLPFLYFWRPRAATRTASAELEHAEAMLRSEQDQTRSDLKTRWSKVQAVGRLVDLYRTSILPQAEQAVKVTETAYQTERVDFSSLLDSQRALLEFRLDYDEYVSQYGQSAAELERTLGGELSHVTPAAVEENSHGR